MHLVVKTDNRNHRFLHSAAQKNKPIPKGSGGFTKGIPSTNLSPRKGIPVESPGFIKIYKNIIQIYKNTHHQDLKNTFTASYFCVG